jgi:hypothetical protein
MAPPSEIWLYKAKSGRRRAFENLAICELLAG